MNIAIATVTYNNSSIEIAHFAQSLGLAISEVASLHEVSLCFSDNGKPSDLGSHFPSAIKLESPGNIGFAKSMNRLLKLAFEDYSADAVISSNPDGAFHYMTIKNLAELAAECPDALIEGMQFPMELAKAYDPISLDTDWASWCCLLIPKEIYNTVGPLDENFFMYLEDVDYSWRVRLSGFRVKICAGGLYAHPNAARIYEQPSRSFLKHNLESGRYLGWKWGDLRFKDHCERTLVKKGYFASTHEIPEIPAEAQRVNDPCSANVACFNEPYFTFSKVRW